MVNIYAKPQYVAIGAYPATHRGRMRRDGKIVEIAVPVTITRLIERRLMRKPKFMPHQGKRECERRRRQMRRAAIDERTVPWWP